jgi:2-methylcitrate dehydratase PrpD
MSIIEELVSNVLETSFESFDLESIEQAKNRIIEVIGCSIGGANATGCNTIVDLVKKWGGVGESTILVYGGKAPANNVAMVNSIMARSFDFEPVEAYVEGTSRPAHISGTTVPTALAVAEQTAASGRELISSLVLGNDLTSRLAVASGFPLDLGWDNTGTFNIFGATAIAGRLLRLDKRQMLNAFGIALNQLAGSLQGAYDKTHCFKLPIGLSARAGIFSAELASQGLTGVKDPLLGKYGYFALYCRDYNPEILTKDLGRQFYSDSVLKPYPACRGTHAAIESALQIAHMHDIEPGNIDEITVNVTAALRDGFLGQQFEIGDVPQVDATFSLRYTVANALLRKSVRLEHFSDEFIHDPKVVKLASRIKLTANIPPEKPLAAGLEVKMKGGEIFSANVDIPKGDTVHNPLTKQEIKEKFRSNVTFSRTVARENAEKALTMIEKLEEISDLGEITSLLVKV